MNGLPAAAASAAWHLGVAPAPDRPGAALHRTDPASDVMRLISVPVPQARLVKRRTVPWSHGMVKCARIVYGIVEHLLARRARTRQLACRQPDSEPLSEPLVKSKEAKAAADCIPHEDQLLERVLAG